VWYSETKWSILANQVLLASNVGRGELRSVSVLRSSYKAKKVYEV
jgi:hypothetical protein